MPRLTPLAPAFLAAAFASGRAVAAEPVVPTAQRGALTVPQAPQDASRSGYHWAPPPPEPDRPSPGSTTRWYGYQTLLVDAASVGVMLAGASDKRIGPASAIGLGAFALGAPIVHAAHGHPGKAALDLGLRVVVPVGIGATLAATCSRSQAPGDDGSSCNMASFAVGVLIGVPIAILVDSTTLARETVPTGPRVAIAPLIDGDRRGVAVTGTF